MALWAAWAGLVGGSCDCGEPLAELTPALVVNPLVLDLGSVRVASAIDAEVEVGNTGAGRLSLTAELQVGDGAFSLIDAPSGLAAGEQGRVRLQVLVPQQGPVEDILVLRSSDPARPLVEVPLRAVGGPPRLVVEPDPVDLGRVNQGPGASRDVLIRNGGFDVMTLVHVAPRGVLGYSVAGPVLPVALLPGESLEWTVRLDPDANSAAALDGEILRDVLRVVVREPETGGTVLEAGLPGGGQALRDVPLLAAVNLAPVAVAVEQISRRSAVKVSVAKRVDIDGSDTVDPEGDPFSFSWSLVQRPADSVATLVGQGQPTTRITPDAVGQYRVRLRATDVHGAFSEADVEIGPRDLSVVLTWTTQASAGCRALSDAQCAALSPQERALRCCGQSDLDLHLLGPDGVLGDVGGCPAGCPDAALCTEEGDAHVDQCRSTGLDCGFANRFPEWGVPGRIDDPRLDVDDVRGAGPEIISIDEPAPGLYRVVVHYCLDRIGEPSLATVTLFEEGLPVRQTGPQPITEGQAWVAAILQRNAPGATSGPWTIVTPPGVFESAPPNLCRN